MLNRSSFYMLALKVKSGIMPPFWFQYTCSRNLSSNQLATALRPFYFVVHPDLFGRHPKERAVNENSLKQLTAYLEMVQHNRPVRPTNVTFYLRPPPASLVAASDEGESLRAVDIILPGRDIKATVQHILKSCDISTTYIDSLPNANTNRSAFRKWNARAAPPFDASDNLYRRDSGMDDVEAEMSRKHVDSLNFWLRKNNAIARRKLEATKPIRDEAKRLQFELCHRLRIGQILWSCGWGIAHFKGCLQSLESLRQHHSDVLRNLEGRVVSFGNITGVNLDGHVILSSGDVRNSWLELIKKVNAEDVTLKRIPAVEAAVSRVLRDIKVVHRKFKPAMTAQTYENHLRMLSATLADFWIKNGYPRSWPQSLSAFQLVVECDAGPLMLSPTGQFIVPASCPASLLVNFITDNLAEANRKLLSYKKNKREEEILHDLCVRELRLEALHKDDNVTPDRMIHCLQRLLQQKEVLEEFLHDTQLNVTHFYSVLQDGEMCIPWNWLE